MSTTRTTIEVVQPESQPSLLLFVRPSDLHLHQLLLKMTTGGAVYKDLLPIPTETEPTPINQERSTHLTDRPSESHALAVDAARAPEEKGAAQIAHGQEVVNLGWNEPTEEVVNPLVGGLSNEDLWVLIRRFNGVRIPSGIYRRRMSS